MADPIPSLDDRRAMYAAWRSQLSTRAERNRALVEDEVVDQPALGDEWSADRLFEESRRVTEAERAS